MTKQDIIDKIQRDLDDTGTQSTVEEIYDSLEDGHNEVVILSGCHQKSVTLEWPVDTTYIDVISLVSDYYRPVAIYNKPNKSWLIPRTPKQMESLGDRWEVENGTPIFFCPLDFKYISVYPHYGTAENEFILFYKAVAPEDWPDTEEPKIPLNCQDVLVNYVNTDMYISLLEYTKSDNQFAIYKDGLARTQRQFEGQAGMDMLWQMVAQLNG